MPNRIRELRHKHDMTMRQLGEQLGLAESTISQYETGKRNPDNETLLKLGELFGVSVGHILGNDDSALPPEMYINIGKRIEQVAIAADQSAAALLSRLGISASTANEMVAGQYPFTMDTLSQIAHHLGRPLEYFLTKETAPALTKKDERDIDKRLEAVLEDLESGQGGLAFSGEPLDDETRELLIKSLRNSMEVGKALAKKKFTPKKYKKE